MDTTQRVCSLPECDRPYHGNGYCGMHNARRQRTGDPRKISRTTTVDSFWKRVNKSGPGGCWIWTGYIHKTGYGGLATTLPLIAGGSRLAHRASYELHRGDIPKGTHLDHLCRVRACVNPEHLEVVTPKVNTERGLHGVLRTHCKYGHELTPENTWYEEKTNCRRCLRCAKANSRRRALATKIGNESFNRTRRKPCKDCGAEKSPGLRKKYCDPCYRRRQAAGINGMRMDAI